MPAPTTVVISASLILFGAPPQAGFGPDMRAACLEQAGQALEFLEQDDFVGSYLETSRSVVAKLNGKDREDTLEVHRVSRHPGEPVVRELLRREHNGEPVTMEGDAEAGQHGVQVGVSRRSDPGAQDAVPPETGDDTQASEQELKLPIGADLNLFRFSQTRLEDGLAVASFEPARQHRKRKDLAQGSVACDPASGTPAWLEFGFARRPRGLKELTLRVEFAPIADQLYARRVVTDGVGGFLWIKRRFHAEEEISELQLGD